MSKRHNVSNVAIIGAGEIGQAIARLMSDGCADVRMWDSAPGKVADQKPLEQLLPWADTVVYCIPSWHLESAVKATVALLSKNAIIVSVTKGIEQTSGKTMDLFWPSMLPDGQAFALLFGPMLAEEIQKDMGAVSVIACADKKIYRKIERLFNGANIRLEYSRDVHGLVIASVCKNIYSLAMGVANGLGWGGNRIGWLASCAIKEISDHLRRVGAKKGALFTPAGIADFLATAFSPFSSNRKTGSELVLTGLCEKSEGLVSLQPFINDLGEAIKDYPLLQVIEKVFLRKEDPRVVFEKFFHG